MDMMFDLKDLGGRGPETYQEKFKEMCPGKNQDEGLSLHLVEAEPRPRLLKSHYPLTLLPKDILDKIKVNIHAVLFMCLPSSSTFTTGWTKTFPIPFHLFLTFSSCAKSFNFISSRDSLPAPASLTFFFFRCLLIYEHMLSVYA